MEAKETKRQQRINIRVPEDLEAIYSNFALITHSASEIIIDFARLLPNSPRTSVYARVVMTPMNAKLLHRALGTNLEKYEEQFGEVNIPDDKGFGEERVIGFHH